MENMKNMDVKPHASKCGAKTRSGTPCRNWAMKNKKRCQNHGGKSTGPRTVAGRERIRQRHWKHGWRSAQAREEHREFRKLLTSAQELAKQIEEGVSGNSISLDELNSKIEQEEQVRSKLFSMIEGYKYLTFRDRLALGKYIRSELSRGQEFFEGIINRPKSDTPPSGSSGGSEWPKTFVIRVSPLTQKITLEEK